MQYHSQHRSKKECAHYYQKQRHSLSLGSTVCPPRHCSLKADGPRRPEIQKNCLRECRSWDGPGILRFWASEDQDGSLLHDHQDHHRPPHEHRPDSISVQLCSDKIPREKWSEVRKDLRNKSKNIHNLSKEQDIKVRLIWKHQTSEHQKTEL